MVCGRGSPSDKKRVRWVGKNFPAAQADSLQVRMNTSRTSHGDRFLSGGSRISGTSHEDRFLIARKQRSKLHKICQEFQGTCTWRMKTVDGDTQTQLTVLGTVGGAGS